MTENNLHFEVHPSVLFQLGESLITDNVQALIELVKNCYDADASYAKVTIDTLGHEAVEGSRFERTKGWIMIEDDGHGMSDQDITRGWLTISNRQKREIKLASKTTPKGRSPLGDKGLGRLGVQRLGDCVEIFTKRTEEPGYYFGFSWLDFLTAPTLRDVDITLTGTDLINDHGTRLLITDLKDLDSWRGGASLSRLQRELSQMISPFKKIRNFNVMVSIDGKVMELAEISEAIREIAPVRYSFKFDGDFLEIKGRMRLDFLKPNSKEEIEEFTLCVESDGGKSLAEYLLSRPEAQAINLEVAELEGWFVEFRWRKRLSEMDNVHYVIGDSKEIANPGPFEGEIDAFDLGASASKQQTYFSKISEYRRHVKEISGVKVYRDGFGIKMPEDWLELGKQWTSASSYFGLKPGNTLGYISLSAQNNIKLEETTDREGFKDSAYYRNFYRLLGEFKSFTLLAQEFFGRKSAEFRKLKAAGIPAASADNSLEEISKGISTSLKSALDQREKLVSFRNQLSKAASNNEKFLPKLADVEVVEDPRTIREISSVLVELQTVLVNAGEALDQLDLYLSEIESVKKDAHLLDSRVATLRKQMDDMYETVALGMVAEALSHEVFNVADQLSSRSLAAKNRIKRAGTMDKPLLAFVEHVQTAANALRKQMTFLSPALRYVRDTKNDIDLQEALNELAAFYEEKLARNSIKIEIPPSSSPIKIRMNRGKLIQIIDNFISNSEYWLKQEIAKDAMRSCIITFECSKPFLRISDNGRGIDPNLESILFEPFISGKGSGRGLGLFIVKQLLDSDGCSVGILPERNHSGRLYKFQIDFRGALS